MLYMSFDAYQQDDQRSNPKRRDTSKYMSKSKACAGDHPDIGPWELEFWRDVNLANLTTYLLPSLSQVLALRLTQFFNPSKTIPAIEKHNNNNGWQARQATHTASSDLESKANSEEHLQATRSQDKTKGGVRSLDDRAPPVLTTLLPRHPSVHTSALGGVQPDTTMPIALRRVVDRAPLDFGAEDQR